MLPFPATVINKGEIGMAGSFQRRAGLFLDEVFVVSDGSVTILFGAFGAFSRQDYLVYMVGQIEQFEKDLTAIIHRRVDIGQ